MSLAERQAISQTRAERDAERARECRRHELRYANGAVSALEVHDPLTSKVNPPWPEACFRGWGREARRQMRSEFRTWVASGARQGCPEFPTGVTDGFIVSIPLPGEPNPMKRPPTTEGTTKERPTASRPTDHDRHH